MKITRLFSTFLTGAVLAAQMQLSAAMDATVGWKTEVTFAQQAYNQDPEGRARADAIVSAVLEAITEGIPVQGSSGRSTEQAPAGANLDAATAQAAYSTLAVLYPGRFAALDATLAESLAAIDDTPAAIATGRTWGTRVAGYFLANQPGEGGRNGASFMTESAPPASHPPSSVVTSPGRYRFSVLAGEPGTPGSADGVGVAARFDRPGGIAMDAAGNVYVSDKNRHTIRKITSDGYVTTFAGVAGESGRQDGAGAVARFNSPQGVAVDGAGNVYVADTGNVAIRKISPSGLVTTFAGSAGTPGSADGVREAARFYSPAYIAVDGAGFVYVAELSDNGIRKITPDGVVSTPAITLPWYYATYTPKVPVLGLAVDRGGTLYALYNNAWDVFEVRKLTPVAGGRYDSSVVTFPVIPTSDNWWGFALCMAMDGSDNLYVKMGSDPIVRFAAGGGTEIRYTAGKPGGHDWEGMCVDGLGKIVAIPSALYSERTGAIEVGIFDPAASGLVISQQPADAVAHTSPRASITAGFAVQAASGSVVTYQWYFNSNRISGATGSTIEIRDVKAGDAGFYSVVVADGTGSITSRSARLVVTETQTPAPVPIAPSALASPSPAPGGSGGGRFEGGMSVALLSLLVVAAARRCKVRAPSVGNNLLG